MDIAIAEDLGLRPTGDLVESNLRALVTAPKGPHSQFASIDVDRRSWLDKHQVIFVDIEAEKAGEAVRPAEPADQKEIGISRRTRRQL